MRYDDPIPELKRIAGAELDRFSLEMLIRYLVRGGRIVELEITIPARPYDRRKPPQSML